MNNKNSLNKIIFSSLLLLLPLFASAQSPYQKADSLRQIITENSSDSLKAEIYKFLSVEYRGINIDSAFMFSQMSLDLSRKNAWSRRQASALLQLGYLKIGLGELPKSKEYLDEAMSISEEIQDTFMMINTLNTLGQLNYSMGRNDIAIRNLQQCYEWAVQIEHEEFIIRTSNNLGIIAGTNNRYQDAINYFEQTKKYSLIKGDKVLVNSANLNIATANKELGNYDIALKGFQEVLDNTSIENNYQNITSVHLSMGDIFFEKEQYDKALYHINESLKSSRKSKTKSSEEAALYSRAKIYKQLNKLNQANTDATKGLQIAKEIGSGSSSELKYFSLLAAIKKSQKKYEDALYWQEKYSVRSDSLEELGRQAEIDELEISFQTKQKEVENVNLKKEKATQDLIIQQRTRLVTAAGALAFLLFIVALLLYRTRQKTKQMNSVLEAKVKDRTEELETSNTLLKQSNEELKRFAFIASHDLKEPIRNMGGFISLIKRRLTQRDDTELIEYIEYAQKSNMQMVNLVDSILNYSKLESKQSPKKEVIELQKVIDDVVLMLPQSINDKQIQINYDNLPNIIFDKSILMIIIKNVVENGLKYNESKTPQIDITYKTNQDNFTLYIKDNGIGISEEFHSKIFEMFTRLHNRDAYNGSGMGLAFCKKLLESHNGSIQVESTEGQGSTFIVSFPAEIA